MLVFAGVGRSLAIERIDLSLYYRLAVAAAERWESRHLSPLTVAAKTPVLSFNSPALTANLPVERLLIERDDRQ